MSSPHTRWKRTVVWVGLLLLPLLLAWPLPRVWRTEILAAPELEAATHIWGLWAALHEGAALRLTTSLLAWPTGTALVLVDPANLPAFALGELAGAVAGYNLAYYAGFLVLGAAGALLAAEVGGAPALGALLAMASPAYIACPAAGMTEEFGLGWVGLQLALLLRATRLGGLWVVAAGAALGVAWYAGPYNGLLASLLDAAVGLSLLLPAIRDPARRPALGRAFAVGGLALLLVAPLAWTTLVLRGADLPGGEARSALPVLQESPEGFRGGLWTGSDLTDPWFPRQLTGGVARTSHTVYLGVVTLAAALAGRRGRQAWLLGAAGLLLLSTGPYLFFQGEALRSGSTLLLSPVGMGILSFPVLGRLTRWYRAAAVARLLLVAPAVLWARGAPWRAPALAGAVVLDALFLAPLAWPLHHNPPPEVPPAALMQGEGALLEVPLGLPDKPVAGGWRDRNALGQTLHGRAIGGNIHLGAPSDEAKAAISELHVLFRTGTLPEGACGRWRAAGFRWLALYPRDAPLPVGASGHLLTAFGKPLHRSTEVLLFALGPEAPGCRP